MELVGSAAAQPPRLPVVIAAWSAWRFYRLSPSPSPSSSSAKIVSCVAHAHTGEGGILWHLLNAMVVTHVVAQEAKVVSLSGLLGVASS